MLLGVLAVMISLVCIFGKMVYRLWLALPYKEILANKGTLRHAVRDARGMAGSIMFRKAPVLPTIQG